jgi:hypothetical protein
MAYSKAFKDGLKRRYLETRKKEVEEMDLGWKSGRGAVYTADDIFNLKEMAKYEVWPDGNFGDEECVLWGYFHSFHRAEES